MSSLALGNATAIITVTLQGIRSDFDTQTITFTPVPGAGVAKMKWAAVFSAATSVVAFYYVRDAAVPASKRSKRSLDKPQSSGIRDSDHTKSPSLEGFSVRNNVLCLHDE